MSSKQRSLRTTLLFTLFLLVTLLITFTAAQEDEESFAAISDDSTSSPDITSSPTIDAQPTASSPSTNTESESGSTSKKPSKPKKTEPPITLPSVLYIPPTSFNINNDALEPIFPSGSESCQKCRYFYPKLKECNQIANQTLGRLPQLVTTGNDTSILVYPSPPLLTNGTTNGTAGATTTILPTPTGPPSTFTTLMPFLQCICPDQGLAATKVCMTCFRVSNQRNFLDQLTLQNVSTSLSAFQEVCEDSKNGTTVPPAGAKGQSASSATSWVEETNASRCWMFLLLIHVSLSLAPSI
ncbi:hypothetical protein FBU30_006809 [Linnemannia zychae]|nr:hypothetical protein FBU30_006809 [Linnemannia zychae]